MDQRLVLLALLFIGVTRVDGALTCLLCDNAGSLEECTQRARCAETEECFLEKITRSDGNFYFNAGCRSQTVCILTLTLNPFGKRQISRTSRELVNCVQCCATASDKLGPCNNRLCNEVPKIESENKCLVCDHAVSSIEECTTYKICEPTQVCGTSIEVFNLQLKYRFRCEERYICKKFLAHSGTAVARRTDDINSTPICFACCYGNRCNKADCLVMRKNMTLSSLGPEPTTPTATQMTTTITPATTTPTTVKRTTPRPTVVAYTVV